MTKYKCRSAGSGNLNGKNRVQTGSEGNVRKKMKVGIAPMQETGNKKWRNFAIRMATQTPQMSGQESTGLFFMQKPDTVSTNDTIVSYMQFLRDSLNPALPDTVFRFELKDIVLPVAEEPEAGDISPFNTPSFLTIGVSPSAKIEPLTRTAVQYDWLTLFIIVCLGILAWVRYSYPRRLRQLFKSIYGRHHVNQLLREGNLIRERLTFGLGIVFIAGLAVAVFNLTGTRLAGLLGVQALPLVFLLIAAAITIFWFLKLATIKAIGILFRTKSLSDEYLVSALIYSLAAGLVLFPLITAWHFMEYKPLLYSIIGLLVIVYSMRLIRSISVIGGSQTFSVVFIILYLCTLEILPLLAVYKFYTMVDW